MKKIFFLATLAIIIIAFGVSGLPTTTKAVVTTTNAMVNAPKSDTLGSRLSGRVLLAVQSNGETWYVNPINQKRYFLGSYLDTLNIMQQLGLGISNSNFDSFNGKAPARLAGRILIKVQSRGEAYYVNPVDLKMIYLGKPDQALRLMQGLSLGITDANLDKILVSENVNVTITNDGFNPANITIDRGSMVTWTNYSSSPQTITSPNYFNFGEIASGKTYNRMFNIVGTYNYYSINQTGMTGSIIVR